LIVILDAAATILPPEQLYLQRNLVAHSSAVRHTPLSPVTRYGPSSTLLFFDRSSTRLSVLSSMGFPKQILLLCTLHAIYTNAVAKTVYIDDQNGDEDTGLVPTYTPAQYWEQGSKCPGCALQPNPSLTYDNTWHDATYDPVLRPPGVDVINIFFSGTGIDVYYVKPYSNNTYVTTSMNLSFTLDHSQVGAYSTPSNNDASAGYTYNVLVYSTEGLAMQSHNLTIQSWAASLFDYAVYTVPDTTTSSSSTSSTPAPPSSSPAPPIANPSSPPPSSPLQSPSTSSIHTSSPGQSSIPSSSTDVGGTSSNTLRSSSSSSSSTPFVSPGGSKPARSSSGSKSSSSSSGPLPTGTSIVIPDPGRSQSHSSLGVIIGAAVGGLVALALLIILFVFLCRRRRSQRVRTSRSEKSVLLQRSAAPSQGVTTLQSQEDEVENLATSPALEEDSAFETSTTSDPDSSVTIAPTSFSQTTAKRDLDLSSRNSSVPPADEGQRPLSTSSQGAASSAAPTAFYLGSDLGSFADPPPEYMP